jgi:hypothetical protein
VAKKKHKTPKHLDHLFERKVIKKSQYEDFWEGYWNNKRERDKTRYTDRFVSELQMELPYAKRIHSGTITWSVEAAREQARQIGGYVMRVNKNGKPSKRGKFFRAIYRKRKGQ